jgi:hypothetical protein
VLIPLLDLLNHSPVPDAYYYYTVLPSLARVGSVAELRSALGLAAKDAGASPPPPPPPQQPQPPLSDRHVMLLVAARALDADAEVSIRYNEQLNAVSELLQYGFVSSLDGRNDFVQLFLRFDEPRAAALQSIFAALDLPRVSFACADAVVPLRFAHAVAVAQLPPTDTAGWAGEGGGAEAARDAVLATLRARLADKQLVAAALEHVGRRVASVLASLPTSLETDESLLAAAATHAASSARVATLRFRVAMKRLLTRVVARASSDAAELRAGRSPPPAMTPPLGVPREDAAGAPAVNGTLMWPFVAVDVSEPAPAQPAAAHALA